MPNLHAELRDTIIAYKAYLKTGVRCMRPLYRDSDDGSGSVPVGEIECISIRGIHAVEEMRQYQERLDNAISASRADRTLGPALDALPDGSDGYGVLFDLAVNPVVIAEPYRAQFKSDPWSEHIRADLLDALERALARMPAGESSSDGPGGAAVGGQGGEYGGFMTQKIEVKDSPGAVVSQISGSSNRVEQNQAKEGFLQQIGRQIVRWFSGLFSRSNKPRGS